MSHLKLVVKNTPRKRKLSPPADTQRPIPTPEFLARRVLALPLGERTIATALAKVADWFRSNDPYSSSPCSVLIDALMLVGIWFMLPETDDDPPMHGLVVYPDKLVKRYPELKRVQDQLDGLMLMPPPAA